MDGGSEWSGDRQAAGTRAEIARLEQALAAERRERAALLARLEAAQATQHEMVLLLGRFLAAREREKAEWQAALDRERARAERPVIEGVATVAEPARKAMAARPAAARRAAVKPPARETKPNERDVGADRVIDDFADSPILTFDHVERTQAGARRERPAHSAEAVAALPAPAMAAVGGPLPLLRRIEPLARLGQAAREGIARLRVPKLLPSRPFSVEEEGREGTEARTGA
jgi:hypothetical protein